MARDFVKNNSNVMNFGGRTLADLLSGSGSISVHAWINVDSTTTGGSDNKVVSAYIEGGSNAIRLTIRNTDGTRKILLGGRSVIGDTLQTGVSTTDIPLNTWVAVGGVLNYGADTITPYYNGTAEGGGSVTFNNSTLTPGGATTANDSVGAGDGATSTSTNGQLDGRIAEVAIWSGDIGAAGFAQLANGFSPKMVRPDILAWYVPLWGNNSPESDFVSGKNGTIIGTLAKADHPRTIYPSAAQIRRFSTTIAGSLIKTINSLAEASVKTVNNLANASVKTWNGLA